MAGPVITLCPRCGNKVTWNEASLYRPFCSERCHLSDLGAWLNEEHSISDEDPDTAMAASRPDSEH